MGSVDSWLAKHPHLFSSEQSFRWWLRKHRQELADGHAIVRLREQWFATDQLDVSIARIATRDAKSKLQQAA